MTANIRKEIEGKIIRKAVEGLIAAGYKVGLFDEEDHLVTPGTDAEAVMTALFSVDDEYLTVSNADGKRCGWVRLIHGNMQDVISDYTTNLEAALKGAMDLADHYSK